MTRPQYIEAVAKPPLPPLPKRIVNLAKAVPSILASNFEKAPDHVQAERREICIKCQFWNADAYGGGGGCTHEKCGCTANKLIFSVSECPINRWGKYEMEGIKS